jgi:hypothetical protein
MNKLLQTVYAKRHLVLKNWYIFLGSLVFLVVILYSVVDRCVFLFHSERIEGQVVLLGSRNAHYRGDGGSSPCTDFTASIRYVVSNQPYGLTVDAGSISRHNQPTTFADYRVGDRIPLIYNTFSPSEAYRYAFWDIWGLPLLAGSFLPITLGLGILRCINNSSREVAGSQE